MKIRSVLLGSAAIATVAGLSSVGYAADLGVVTSLDVCNQLNLTGLTISSDDNCLVISGNVKYEYDFGDYKPGYIYGRFAETTTGNHYTVLQPNGTLDSDSNAAVWLKFAASAPTDFGPATATIKLVSNNIHGTGNPNSNNFTAGGTAPYALGTLAFIGEAWVGVGDTTQLMAGFKSSIFNVGDDAPLNYLGLFNSSAVNTGVGFRTSGAGTGGDVIQVTSNLGNGLQVSGGLEHLGSASGVATAVGVLAYAGDGLSAHVSVAADTASNWKLHAGFTGAWDPIKVVAALSADNTGYWDALGSVAATFDMFTLAGSAEATSLGEWGYGGSATAKVSDGVSINLGGRFFHGVVDTAGNLGNPYDLYQVEAAIAANVTETLTLTGAIGATDTTITFTPPVPLGGAAAAPGLVYYGSAGIKWAPGGGFTAGSSLTVNSAGGYKAVFTAAKSIK